MALSSYIPQVLGSSMLMISCYLLGRMDYSSLWVIIFVALNFLKSKMWKARQKRQLSLQAAAKFEREIVTEQLEHRLQDLPPWVHFPDIERVEWVNKMILQLWPHIGEYAKVFINENIIPIVKENLPGPFRSFQFENMDMGDIPVRVGGIKVYSENVARDTIVMDMDISYAGDCNFVVAVGAFKGGLNSLQFRGRLRAICKPLVPRPPLMGGVEAYFLDNPTIDFDLTGLGEMVELPGLFSAIKSVVVSQVANICVLPNSITIPLLPDVDPVKLYFPTPDGIVRIHLIEARNLENRDMSFLKKGKSDPYCHISVGGQMFKSPVIDNDLSPKWNEFYEAIVDQAVGQNLVVEMFDEDPGSKDEELGRTSIDMDNIRAKGTSDQWYPLENCKHGDVHLKITWLNLSDNPKDLETSRIAAQQWEQQWLNADMTLNSALLLVFIDSAKNLPYIKSNLEPSPYIEVSVGKQVEKTYVKTKTTNPVYQQRFSFLLDNPENQRIRFEAKNQGNNRSLGDIDVPISAILKEPNMEIYQHSFSMTQGSQASPLLVTMRLRVFTTAKNPNPVPTSQIPAIAAPPRNIVASNGVSEPRPPNMPTFMHSEGGGQTVASSGAASTLPRRSPGGASLDIAGSGPVGASRMGSSKLSRSSSFIARNSPLRSRVRKRKLSTASLAVGKLGHIVISIRYLPANDKLVATVHRAEDLCSRNTAKTAHAYCKVKLMQGLKKLAKQKTRIEESTLNPIWDESFEFSVPQSELRTYSLLFCVKDASNYGWFHSKPVLGQILYSMNDYNDANRPDHTIFDLGPQGYKEASSITTINSH